MAAVVGVICLWCNSMYALVQYLSKEFCITFLFDLNFFSSSELSTTNFLHYTYILYVVTNIPYYSKMHYVVSALALQCFDEFFPRNRKSRTESRFTNTYVHM